MMSTDEPNAPNDHEHSSSPNEHGDPGRREGSGPAADRQDRSRGPKFYVDIEGTLYNWDDDTITPEQIAELGGWDPSKGVILIDKENNQRTLKSGEVVELDPGMGFAKKHHFKRGLE